MPRKSTKSAAKPATKAVRDNKKAAGKKGKK